MGCLATVGAGELATCREVGELRDGTGVEPEQNAWLLCHHNAKRTT
jgi:hypothetical protein